ncbi:hypothetical protein ABZ876_05430 [Streptomyces sp. NPDC046931]|uniref:hypothetical protein n=1 Tax=Streptomyces sp. NPDC046931 TaxID=3154806 RepID=UPI00341051F6
MSDGRPPSAVLLPAMDAWQRDLGLPPLDPGRPTMTSYDLSSHGPGPTVSVIPGRVTTPGARTTTAFPGTAAPGHKTSAVPVRTAALKRPVPAHPVGPGPKAPSEHGPGSGSDHGSAHGPGHGHAPASGAPAAPRSPSTSSASASSSPSQPSTAPSRAGNWAGEGRERPGRPDFEEEDEGEEPAHTDPDSTTPADENTSPTSREPDEDSDATAEASLGATDLPVSSSTPSRASAAPARQVAASQPMVEILPLGSGLVLIGLGLALALLGLRLRRD